LPSGVGYTVVTKAIKEFVDASGRRKMKGNMDVELGVNVMESPSISTRWLAAATPWPYPMARIQTSLSSSIVRITNQVALEQTAPPPVGRHEPTRRVHARQS
jgi:hypothetical protein